MNPGLLQKAFFSLTFFFLFVMLFFLYLKDYFHGIFCKVTGNPQRETDEETEFVLDSVSHVSCTLARGTTGCSISLCFHFFCVCVWSLLNGSLQQHLSHLCPLFFVLSLPRSPPFSGPACLVPRALYLLNSPQKEKKCTPNINKTSL